ncbi:MAG: hypothetical protein M5T61_21050 [Acidimicrobiia bacterium]|nr:hypothetical protein [Acidimicrobiia bacterium]
MNPFGALDALTRTFMQDELLKLWASDEKTVVFVTHSIDKGRLSCRTKVVVDPETRARGRGVDFHT